MVKENISLENLIGKQVIGIGGFVIGEVAGAAIEKETWNVPMLHVKLSDNAAVDLGFKKRFRSSKVCIPTDMVQAVGDVVTISPSLEELSQSKKIVECKL